MILNIMKYHFLIWSSIERDVCVIYYFLRPMENGVEALKSYHTKMS
jgi:hypothetical protein